MQLVRRANWGVNDVWPLHRQSTFTWVKVCAHSERWHYDLRVSADAFQ